MVIHPMLQVIPVLDLLDGRVVRGIKGERSAYRPIVSQLAAGSEPRALARALLASCASQTWPAILYVADLDAIQGGAAQVSVLAALLDDLPQTSLWLDAGFADVRAAQVLRAQLGSAGARVRPVYGSESLASLGALADVAADPDAILSLDCRQTKPLDPAGCWQQPGSWPDTVIVMTLDRVGANSGPDLSTFERLRAMAPGRQWIGAGGIRDESDLPAAAAAGASGWLVASALHDGRIGGAAAPVHADR